MLKRGHPNQGRTITLVLPTVLCEEREIRRVSKIPKSYNATPTFAGLVAKGFEGKGTTTLVPWASLEKTPGPAWPVCDKNGVRILHNGRPVVLFANGDRQSRLARRLYLRHLEPGWKSGELTFTISCANEKRCLLLASGVCLALGLGLALAVAPKLPAFWSPDPPFLEYKYLVLSPLASSVSPHGFLLGFVSLLNRARSGSAVKACSGGSLTAARGSWPGTRLPT
jgi:hypothetical protein